VCALAPRFWQRCHLTQCAIGMSLVVLGFRTASSGVHLAQAGALRGRKATTNKFAFSWVASVSRDVTWVPHARWVADGNVLSSAGVSAGMDATLHLIHMLLGEEAAQRVATHAEYYGNWKDAALDPFGALIPPTS
jgi:transcriptional regulator GlxA family with amidase domain